MPDPDALRLYEAIRQQVEEWNVDEGGEIGAPYVDWHDMELPANESLTYVHIEGPFDLVRLAKALTARTP